MQGVKVESLTEIHVYAFLSRRAVAWSSHEAVVLASRQQEAAEEAAFRPEATSLKFSSDWGAESVLSVRLCEIFR